MFLILIRIEDIHFFFFYKYKFIEFYNNFFFFFLDKVYLIIFKKSNKVRFRVNYRLEQTS